MMSQQVLKSLGNVFRFFASLKTAIPLLVITIIVTIGGSFLPNPDFFKTWWYLSLLALNGVSLFFITILHIPMILERKGRNALIGVVATHLGILVLIAGIIYGNLSGLRFETRIIEGEMVVIPGLPFMVQLDRLIVEEYQPGEVSNLDPGVVPRKRQESHLSFYKGGELLGQAVVAPGMPAKFDGFTILPSFNEIGWYFELLVKDPRGNDKVVPVLPWSPPIINVRQTPVMAHALVENDEPAVQVFTVVDGVMAPLGIINRGQSVSVNGSPVALGDVKRYTGLIIYNRPHAPVLIAGSLMMLFGLVWHFYFRHRDRKTRNEM